MTVLMIQRNLLYSEAKTQPFSRKAIAIKVLITLASTEPTGRDARRDEECSEAKERERDRVSY